MYAETGFGKESIIVGEIIPFRRRRPSERHKGKSLCSHGFHKWELDTEKTFDVKKGRLVTRMRCTRCGVFKVEAT